MHVRRALLLMALVLGVVAVVEALVPVPREQTVETVATPPPPPVPTAPVRTLALSYPAARQRTFRLLVGDHVVLEVGARTSGQASVAGLGLVQAVEPGTPARFDVLATAPGSYVVAFAPTVGGQAQLGRVVVRAGR